MVATSDALLGQGSPLETMQKAVSLSEWTDRVSIFRHPSLVHGMLLKWAELDDLVDEIEARTHEVDILPAEDGAA